MEEVALLKIRWIPGASELDELQFMMDLKSLLFDWVGQNALEKANKNGLSITSVLLAMNRERFSDKNFCEINSSALQTLFTFAALEDWLKWKEIEMIVNFAVPNPNRGSSY